MTYNFDQDKWFDNECSALNEKRDKGELSEEEYEAEMDRLVEKYEEMAERLNIRHDYSGK